MTVAWMKRFPKRTQNRIIPFIVISCIIGFGAVPFYVTQFVKSSIENQAAMERTLTLFDFDRVSHARSGISDRFFNYLWKAPLGAGLSRIGSPAGTFENVIKANPFFKGTTFFSDNLWLEILVDLGLPGLIILTLLLVQILWIGFRSLWRIQDPEILAVQGAIFTSVLLVALGGYGAEPILYNPEGPFFWFFSGALVRLAGLEQEVEKLPNSDRPVEMTLIKGGASSA